MNDVDDVRRIAKPPARPLRVYAFDPSAGRYVDNEMLTLVRYEKLAPGPVGDRFAVVDYDASEKIYYEPVDLEDPRIVMRNGLNPSESDPRFHQQMVYAVASETLQRFEVALGRRLHWARFDPLDQTRDKAARDVLLLFPHAMSNANAFYSREAQGILFGYFRASTTDAGNNLPGQTIYSCLSHDIIAHETTHAILDGIRSYFTEPTNIDVAAFHEAFADLSALFCHFSHREVLLDTLMKTGGRLYDTTLRPDAPAGSGTPLIQAQLVQINPLAQLALQFGEGSGMHRGLRQMLGAPPNTDDIQRLVEPHARGAILVAAVFDAYFTTYTRRTADLFRIYRAGGGAENPVDLPDALAHRLADEASRTAEEFFTICARALDYCPPVDIVFGDFLRAIITAHADLHPTDVDGVRSAFMEAFRLRGILPQDTMSLTEQSVCWPQVADDKLPEVKDLLFGDPNGLTHAERNHNGNVLRAYANQNAAKLGFKSRKVEIEVPSFHPMFRVGRHGDLLIDMVVELVQTERREDPQVGPYLFRNGVTLLIWQEPPVQGVRPPPRIHYLIAKHHSHEREKRQRLHYSNVPRTGRHNEQGHLDTHDEKHRPIQKSVQEVASAWRIDFGLVHGGV